MRALIVNSLGGLDATAPGEAPTPTLADLDEPAVLVDVRAAGLTFPDVLMTRGEYQGRPEPPFSPGIEVAGTVLEADPETGFTPGDRVAAHCAFGGLAERAVVPAVMCFPLNARLGFTAGAGLVVNYHTAVFALKFRGGLGPGETVLVHGAAGGLGSAALQVTAGLGARSIAVVSSDEKAELARTAGATHVVMSGPDWDAEVLELVGDNIDLVFDPVGGDRVTPSLRLLAADGRFVVVGFTSGEIPEVKVNRLLLRNISVVGAGWGAYLRRRPAGAGPIAAEVDRLIDSGHIVPLVTGTYTLENAIEGLRLIDQRMVLGKLVVEIQP